MSLLNKCSSCGCEDSFLTTPAPYPTTVGCLTPQACGSVIDAKCVIYTGEPIMCGENVVVPTNTDMATAMQALVSFNCNL